ncbi:MAG: VCBS repeat-containing protein [Clostridia bacterium]|nr:VCBS repeat-containing protein [Clostridia bacterium]
MGTLRDLKIKMKLDKELRPMLVRSMRHELLLDLDGDKVADIALIDNNRDGDIDMIAVDATGNGDFNLYLGDQDGNGVPDIVEFYQDGDDMPVASYFGRNVEERFLEIGERIYRRVVAKELIAAELIAAFNEFVARAEEEYAKVAPEGEAEEPTQSEETTEEADKTSEE